MKKLASILAALLALCLVLTGCDELPGSGSDGNSPASNSPSGGNAPASGSPSGGSTSDNKTGGGSEYGDLLSQGEYVEGEDEDGYLNDVMHTRWFNFLIDEAYTTSTYADYTAPEGSQLLVIHIAMKNTTRLSQSMSDVDFQAQWADSDKEAYSWPVTTDDPIKNQVQTDHQLSDEQLPVVYELAVNEVRDGDLIFVVPSTLPDGSANKDFSISFVEIFGYDENDEPEYGDYYFIYFTAEAR